MESMESRKLHNFSLEDFKKSQTQMIATSDQSYDIWGYGHQYRSRLKTYSTEEVEKIIDSGSLQEQQELSANYFWKNGFYKRLLIHYATLLKYVGILISNPTYGKNLSTDHIQKRYYNAVDFVERMNLPKLFTECALRALRDGTYYGVITKLDKQGFAMLDLPGKYCCSRFKDAFGNDIIEFNVMYFNTILLDKDRKAALSLYPKEVQKHYHLYSKGKASSPWVMVPTEIGVCFPFFDGRPFFLNVIPATIQYDEAVDIEKARNLEEIKKIIVQKIPHLADGMLLFEPDEAAEMHAGTCGMMKGNKNVSVLTTYADTTAIASHSSNETAASGLENMKKNIYNEAGTSGQLFASDGSNTLEASVKNDIALMMYLANKFATFVSNIVNSLYSNGNVNFKYQILPVSIHNEEKYVDSAFKLAQFGYSALYPAIAMGISQRDLINIKSLENDVLDISKYLIPLSSSHTQSGANKEGGRPQKEEDEKAEKTLKNEESLDNQAKK